MTLLAFAGGYASAPRTVSVRGARGVRWWLQLELQVFDVGEADLLQAAGAAAAILEVHLAQRVGGDLLELLVAGAGLLGVEEAGGMLRGQGDGQVPDAGVVRRPDRCGVAEACAGVDDDNELVEAADEKQLTKTIARYGRVDLLCIDELGYMELDRHGAELLFQVLTEREEKNSVAIASNEAFGGWTKSFTDPRLCTAIVDRLPFNGTIIDTGTDSYRLAQSRAKAEKAAMT